MGVKSAILSASVEGLAGWAQTQIELDDDVGVIGDAWVCRTCKGSATAGKVLPCAGARGEALAGRICCAAELATQREGCHHH